MKAEQAALLIGSQSEILADFSRSPDFVGITGTTVGQFGLLCDRGQNNSLQDRPLCVGGVRGIALEQDLVGGSNIGCPVLEADRSVVQSSRSGADC